MDGPLEDSRPRKQKGICIMALARRQFLFGLGLTLLASGTVSAAEVDRTVVYVKDMHCAMCAKKIASKLSAVPGVMQVKTQVKKGMAVVVTEKGKPVSPRALWEAVEAASFEPVRVAGALGSFDKKPVR